jgi:hypothetical protein
LSVDLFRPSGYLYFSTTIKRLILSFLLVEPYPMNIRKSTLFCLLAVSCIACKKGKPGSDPAVPELPMPFISNKWIVNDDSSSLTKAHEVAKPFYHIRFIAGTPADTAILFIQFFRKPTAGMYTVITYDARHLSEDLETPGTVCISVTENKKIYRNYKQPVQAVEIVESAGFRTMRIPELWLYNENDINDSVVLRTPGMPYGKYGGQWTVNGEPSHREYFSYTQTQVDYEWRFDGDHPSLYDFRVRLRDLPVKDGPVQLTVMDGLSSAGVWCHLPLTGNNTYADLTKTSTALVEIVRDGYQFRLQDYIVVSKPTDQSDHETPYGPWTDTFRISADLFLQKPG